MNLTVNQLPKRWKPNNGKAFLKWMHKIKSNHYADANKMDNAYLKFETR